MSKITTNRDSFRILPLVYFCFPKKKENDFQLSLCLLPLKNDDLNRFQSGFMPSHSVRHDSESLRDPGLAHQHINPLKLMFHWGLFLEHFFLWFALKCGLDLREITFMKMKQKHLEIYHDGENTEVASTNALVQVRACVYFHTFNSANPSFLPPYCGRRSLNIQLFLRSSKHPCACFFF